MEDNDKLKQAIDRVLQLESEVEAEGDASTEAVHLAVAREALHKWVDGVVAVVTSPGVGRVTLIHSDGSESKIASPVLPYLLSRPVSFDRKPGETG